MKTKLLSDVELRARWSRTHEKTCYVEAGTIITPAAWDFIKENGIKVCEKSAQPETCRQMPTSPIPQRAGRAYYVDALTGEEYDTKPENMTHLYGNRLVTKAHPRIEFRGRLDSLTAQIIGVELVAQEEHCPEVLEGLEEILSYVRRILAAEVKEEPLAEVRLLGLSSAEIRETSHHVKERIGIEHPVPNYRMGRLCAALNRLRTQVREAELSAVRAFPAKDGPDARQDIIEGLNRLSSCVYILFCRKLAGCYAKEETR